MARCGFNLDFLKTDIIYVVYGLVLKKSEEVTKQNWQTIYIYFIIKDTLYIIFITNFKYLICVLKFIHNLFMKAKISRWEDLSYWFHIYESLWQFFMKLKLSLSLPSWEKIMNFWSFIHSKFNDWKLCNVNHSNYYCLKWLLSVFSRFEWIIYFIFVYG